MKTLLRQHKKEDTEGSQIKQNKTGYTDKESKEEESTDSYKKIYLLFIVFTKLECKEKKLFNSTNNSSFLRIGCLWVELTKH